MPLNLTALAGKTATAQVNFMSQSANVVYDPMYLTQENLVKAHDDETFTVFFCTLVKSWDVTRNGKKVPLTEKGLATVPLILLRAIFQKIMAEAGDEEEGKGSNDG